MVLRRFVALAATVLTLLAVPTAGADTFRAVVRVGNGAEGKLLDRLRGQTSDLNVQLMTAAYDKLELTLPEQLAAADAVAAASGAQVVVYWVREPASWVLHVVQAAEGRVIVRPISDPGDQPSSATLETAALVLRGILQALIAGETVGLERKDLPLPPSAPPPPAPPPPLLPALPTLPSPPPPPAISPPRHWALVGALLAAGWRDGQSPYGQMGGEARLGMASEHLSFGALGIGSPGVHLTDTLSTVRITRQLMALWAGAGFPLSDWLRMELAARGGAALFTRSTGATSRVVQASGPSTAWSAAVGAEARLELEWSWLGVVAGVGCDYLPTPPILGYVADGSFVRPRPFGHLAPYVILGFAYVPEIQRKSH